MYWNRVLLKDNAKKVLANSYWRVFLVCLAAAFLGESGSTLFGNFASINMNFMEDSYYIDSFSSALASMTMLFVVIAGIIFALFVTNPINVGVKRYLMENRSGFPPFKSMFSVFADKAQYLNVVKVMFQFHLELFLWSLLCFIPGIYKSFQYFYVPYLLAENPYMSYTRAKEISAAMSSDEKMEIFILGLSFIGWELLGVMVCCLGSFFVAPYVSATFAELYAAARAKAFALGVTGPDELADFTCYSNPNPSAQ